MMVPLRSSKQFANHMKRKRFFLAVLILLGAGLIISAAPKIVQASSLVDTKSAAYQTGGYTLDDARDYLIYLMYFILGFVGTLSLAAFVYGGIVFLTSAGSEQKVKKGKEILGAAVVGLVLVFSSVLIIQTLFGGLGINWDASSGKVPSLK